MRVAFFSPLPPVKSGIADYSAALLAELRQLCDVQVFPEMPDHFDPARFGAILYQLGNNEHHAFCYEAALRWPGVVVMHEANLHHLIADITIKRGDWDAYVREVQFDGGPEALAHAQRVRKLEVGPDYEGVPMLRRVLARSRGAVVHSECVAAELRKAGFEGPIAKIPHGAWIPEVDGAAYRERLRVNSEAPLIGVFGFLKPYKRIVESLRAFRRLLDVEPDARMVLVGEPHPNFPLQSIIESLNLSAQARVLGFTPIEDFVGYIAACDIVLNLRFPTVGENSGTLMRSLGLGKAVIVSDVGSFCELPDNICLKVPVDRTEEETLFEYLRLLTLRPELRNELGREARTWVATECNWQSVAERYAAFLKTIESGAEWNPDAPALAKAAHAGAETDAPSKVSVDPEYVTAWAGDATANEYVETHLTRLVKTLEITPPGGPEDRILEMGAYLQITPALKTRLGYGEVRGCYFGQAGKVERRRVRSLAGEEFACDIDLFNAEKDRFPYGDEYFSTVLCCELIEHLFEDPMFLMAEVNRILKPKGHFVLTTPNIASTRAIAAILQGYHPGFFPAYIRPREPGAEVDARHNREYTPREIRSLFEDAGFEVTLLETGPFREEPKPELLWVEHLFKEYGLPEELRHDGIYAVGRKAGPLRERYPAWLYS